jgi:hypothetical protein
VTKQTFDFAYANGIDYVFNQKEYQVFLKSVIDYGIRDFLVISSSSYGLKNTLKQFIKRILEFTGVRKKQDKGQFWGYLRSAGEQKQALIQAGFKNITISKSDKDTLFIRAKI